MRVAACLNRSRSMSLPERTVIRHDMETIRRIEQVRAKDQFSILKSIQALVAHMKVPGVYKTASA